MGQMRLMTVIVPAAAILAALALPAAAQVTTGAGTQHVGPAKGAPQKAAPVQKGPVTGAGAHPAYRQGAQPGPQHGAYVGHERRGYAGRPAYYARHPGFARRDFRGHFYRGSLAWDRGVWRHEVHNGRYGWWWDVGGAWYFYDRPYDGPPTFISEVEVLDDPAMAEVGPPEDVPPPEAYPPPAVVVAPPPAVIVAPPPIVCVGPLCVR
jgi:hypothetical protein